MLPEAAKLQAFALRREGHAVKIIAAELGVSERTCHRWFKRDRSSLDPACDAGLDPSLEAEPCARTKAFAMKEAGYRVTEIADDLDVSVATCDRWFRWGDDRSSRPWQQKLTTSQQEALTDFFSTYASASLEDGIHMLRDRFGASVSLSTARKHRGVALHPDDPWSWVGLSYNSNITMADVEQHPDDPWSWVGLSANSNITMADVERHPDKPWNWQALSRKSSITMVDVERHPDKPWDWSSLSTNPSIKMEAVDAHPDKPWSWLWLSMNPSITMGDVLAHLDDPWDWFWLGRNPGITMGDVLAHPDEPWDWCGLSCNPSVTMTTVLAHPEMPWDWCALSRNRSFTMADVDAHPEKPWDWVGLSWNPSITMADVKAHPEKPWEWWGLSYNPSITISDVRAHLAKPWEFCAVSKRASLKDVLTIDKIQWDCKAVCTYVDFEATLLGAVEVIWRHFRAWRWRRDVLWNPHCELGKRRLLLEYESLL